MRYDMLDERTIASLIRWDVLDKDMWQKWAKKQIDQTEYDDYVYHRNIISKLMQKGDCLMSEDQIRSIDRFIAKLFAKTIFCRT